MIHSSVLACVTTSVHELLGVAGGQKGAEVGRGNAPLPREFSLEAAF